MILNLIYGLFVTIFLLIVYIVGSIVGGVLGCGMRKNKTGNGEFRGGAGDRIHGRGKGRGRGRGSNPCSHHGSSESMFSALDFMSDILGAEDITGDVYGARSDIESACSDNCGEGMCIESACSDVGGGSIETPDFPINDPDLKSAYTAAFMEVYGRAPRPPLVMYEDINGTLKYSESQPIYTQAYHIGQRKLILNEIQFLTRIPTSEHALIVYAGGAPSHKGALLASMFPNLKFLLIDPAKFEIRPYRGVVVTQLDVTNDDNPRDVIDKAFDALVTADICTARVFMTGGISEELGRRFREADGTRKKSSNDTSLRSNNAKDIARDDNASDDTGPKNTYSALYFMSDIRTNMCSDGPTTLDLLWNSAQHIQWVTLMNPRESMLKFRTPFFNESQEEMKNYETESYEAPYAEAFDFVARAGADMRTFSSREFTFFDGNIYLQPWAPVSSTESRLVFAGVPALKKYNPHEYEDKFFYYNKILRNYQLYLNPNADRKMGFDYCADCSLENQIWTDYCKSRGVADGLIRDEVHHYVDTLSSLTYRPLLHDFHGRAFGPIPIQVLMRNFTDYCEKPKRRFFRNASAGGGTAEDIAVEYNTEDNE